MKTISLALACIALASCGKKENTSGPGTNVSLQQEEKVKNTAQDSDFDGISDQLEVKNGMNPYIADTPEIKIEAIGDIEFQNYYFRKNESEQEKVEMYFTKSSKSKIQRLRAEAARMAYSIMYNLNEDYRLKGIRDLNRQQLKCFTQAENKRVRPLLVQKNNSSEFKHLLVNLDIRTKFKKMKGLNEISNPRFDIYLNHRNVNDFKLNRDVFNFRTQNYAFDDAQNINMIQENKLEVADFNEFNNCIETQIVDFKYNLLDAKLSYKKTIENIDQSLAHIVMLQEGTLKQFSVNPKHYTMDKLLMELKGKPVYGHDGNLVSLFDKRNEFESLESINIQDKRNLDKRRWFFLNKDHSRIVEEIKAGEIYILAHLSVLDLLKTKTDKQIYSMSHKNKLKVEDIYPGDQITLEVNVGGNLSLPAEKRYKADGFFYLLGMIPMREACLVHEHNKLLNEKFNPENLERYSLKLKNKIIPARFINGKLFYEFDVDVDDVIDLSLELIFPSRSEAQFTFERMIHRKDAPQPNNRLYCSEDKRVRTNHTTATKMKTYKDLVYQTTITRRGIHRN